MGTGTEKKIEYLTEAEAKYYGVAGLYDKKTLLDLDCYCPFGNEGVEIADFYVIKEGWQFKQEDIFCVYDATDTIKVMYLIISMSTDPHKTIAYKTPVLRVKTICKGYMGDKDEALKKCLERYKKAKQ